MYRFGVDEAGKGPVFGSMFAAAVCVADLEVLPDGIADSKQLSPTRREELARTLEQRANVYIGVAEIPVGRIDDPSTDMNSLAVDAHATAIAAMLEAVHVDQAATGLCDACDTDAERFARRVAERCRTHVSSATVTIDARHGADEESPLVGAASIIAKVERDSHMASLATEYGEIGSGYPSDPTTKRFLESYLEAHGDVPPFARRSWSTCKRAIAETSQRGLEEF